MIKSWYELSLFHYHGNIRKVDDETELPLLIRPGDVQVPLFDTTRLHAEAAVRLALTE